VEQKHLDALKMTLETLRLPSNNMEPPRHQFHFNDIHAIFILEKLLSRVISGSGDANVMPSKNFDHMLFLSFLESISFEDFALNDVATNREEMYDAHTVAKDESSMKVVLPIDDHREDILNAIKTQRVTIIQGGTGSGKSSRVPCFLLRADPPQPSLAAPEVKMIVSQPRRIAAKALAERVRKVEPDLSHKVALRMGHGMKEFETNNTRCWFVTTGKLSSPSSKYSFVL
jgi:HrpA-like RNA helicase